MRSATEFVSAFTSGILGSLGLILAVALGLIFFLALGEIAWTLTFAGPFELAFLFWLTLALAAALVIWRSIKPSHFGPSSASTGTLNLIPLTLLDAFVLFAAVVAANWFTYSFATPLLKAAQTLFGKLTG
jgi:hypothetical protein